jgi:hypothetical protein
MPGKRCAQDSILKRESMDAHFDALRRRAETRARFLSGANTGYENNCGAEPCPSMSL